MDVYRPLRGALFFYETVRLAALAGFAVASGLPGDGEAFPYLACMSPNALFFLMALFVWLRPGEYRAYLPLYAAGKIMAVIAFAGWCIFSFKSLTAVIFLLPPEQAAALGGSFLFSAGDALAFAGALALLNRMNRDSAPAPALVPAGAESPGPAEGGF
jgi:hypothetical protein